MRDVYRKIIVVPNGADIESILLQHSQTLGFRLGQVPRDNLQKVYIMLTEQTPRVSAVHAWHPFGVKVLQALVARPITGAWSIDLRWTAKAADAAQALIDAYAEGVPQ